MRKGLQKLVYLILIPTVLLLPTCQKDESRPGCTVYAADNYDEHADENCCCTYLITYQVKKLSSEALITYWEEDKEVSQMIQGPEWSHSFSAASGDWLSLSGNFTKGSEISIRSGNIHTLTFDSLDIDRSIALTHKLK